MRNCRYIAFSFMMVLCLSCRKNDSATGAQPYALVIPSNLPAPVEMKDNPLTKAGVALGRRLFYEKRLSGNNLISCASCHKQELAFSDGVALNNIGFSGQTLHRNAPALINLAWSTSGLFWDGGSTNLESQAFAPITNIDEMHQDLYQLTKELKNISGYEQAFVQAFDDSISPANVVKALAQFQRTFVSADSRYDKYKRHENGGSLTNAELEGMRLVAEKCQGCHKGDLFTDYGYHNNGLDSDFSNITLEGIYQGRYRITRNEEDLGKFKTPTLRNIMLTAPYMHDGRFASLAEVLNHYRNEVKNTAYTDTLLKQDDTATGIRLSGEETEKIILFLKTLTDESFVSNKNLSSPQ